MSSSTGIDLCLFPAATPPEGITSNFTNPPTYAPAIVAVSAIMMALAVLSTAGRLHANWKKLAWSDYFNLMALILSLGQGGLMLTQLKFVRHQWDIPACWFFEASYQKILYSQSILLLPGLFCSKASLLLLFLQIFKIQGLKMRYAIWAGLPASFLVYFPGIPILSYFGAPSPGQSLPALLSSGASFKPIYWGIVQSSLAIPLDLYLFILPLPITFRLHMPLKKRVELAALFSVAFMGVIANILSLAYRVQQYKNLADATWSLYALLLCTVVELNVSIIVCSVPGFTKFIRTFDQQWSPIKSLQSMFSYSRKAPKSSSSELSQQSPSITSPIKLAESMPKEKNNSHPPSTISSYSTVDMSYHQPVGMSQHQEEDLTDAYAQMYNSWELDPYLEQNPDI